VRELYVLHGEGRSVRNIARTLGISRNTVRKYLRSAGLPEPRARPKRPSKLAEHGAYIRARLAEGVDNCVLLLRELRGRGYTGGYTILKEYVKPLRHRRQSEATMRFETAPGEQAQVDWGEFRYQTPGGGTGKLWAFVMVLSWSRAMYVEYVARADVATFIRCHLNAFERLGIPRRCLYDNCKVVVLDRDEAGQPVWNLRFLDFALRLGFEIKLCAPYRARTKGRVESGVKYLKRNFWPGVRFTDQADLNRQATSWVESVANVRCHGTTRQRPLDLLAEERAHLTPFPGWDKVAPLLWEERKVGRDGYLQWERAHYGVHWSWKGKKVQVRPCGNLVELWAEGRRLAVHPRAAAPGQKFTLPGQWEGLPMGGGCRRRQPLALQVPEPEVERRSLAVYDALAGVVDDG